MAITDSIIKQTASKFSGYLRTSIAEKYTNQYNGATSGTITYPDLSTFTYLSTSALDNQISLVDGIYKSLILSATNYLEIKSLYLLSIQNMCEGGTFTKDTFIDGTYQQTNRPLQYDMLFLDWLDKKIAEESRKDSGNYLRIVRYD